MIRKATLNDMPDLLRMSELFVREAPYTVPFDEETCIETITAFIQDEEENCVLLVAEVGNKVVGMFAGIMVPIYYNKNFKQSNECWWWVDEDYRGGREGVELFRAYEDWAKYYGVHQIAACTMMNNKSLVGWFEKQGYTNREFFCVKEAA